MENYTVDDIRNVIVVAHSGAGKTSLIEAMLFNAGVTTRLGSVASGTSICDYNADEIGRKITINGKFLNLAWKNKKINLVDTPGYADFVGDLIGALRAVDGGVAIIDAISGVEVGTERAWDFLEQYNFPRIICVNKLDKDNTNFIVTVTAIQDVFGKKCIPVQYPIGKEDNFKGAADLLTQEGFDQLEETEKKAALKLREALIEKIAECDDTLIERYLEGAELSLEELQKTLRAGTISGKIIPVVLCSAVDNLAIKPLLNVIADYLPSPSDRGEIKGMLPHSETQEIRAPKSDSPFSALVFKTISDPYVGQLTIFRVFSGSLSSDSGFFNQSKQSKERIGQLYALQGKNQSPVKNAIAGDIVAVAKLKDTTTGDTLCDEKKPILYEVMKFPEPILSVSVKPKSRSDEEKISGALQKLASEDPTFAISRDAQTKELIISGMGDMHLEVMVSRLKSKYNVDVEIGVPKVPYKETIQKKAQVQGKYKRQSGGRGQYGDCWLELEPQPRGKGFEFVDKIFGGAIPRNYVPSVEKGVRGAMQEGVLAGCPVVDIKVTVYDGSFHPVDSSDMAFQIAGSMAFKKGQVEASSVLIEPIMEVEIIIPEEYMGAITGDLNSRRGRIMGMEVRSKNQVIKATAPLAEMLKYATELRSITGGRGVYSMKYSHYEEVPQKIAQTIISQSKKSEEKQE
ncbi:MAG: elongation factor G [Candidatus Omnitrophota bacterium]